MAPLTEHETIARYFAPLAGPEGLLLADDVALLSTAEASGLAVNTDMIIEGVHFLDDPPEAIAAKALRVNLSDLAAKGSTPFAYSLALGLAEKCGEEWVGRFAAALAHDQQRYGVTLIGGDTNRSAGQIVVSITAFGRTAAGKIVRRSGAGSGDVVMVTGTIGDAALGLALRRGAKLPIGAAEAAHLSRRHRWPEPRVELAPVLAEFATASIDISDGLVGDLGKLCRASGVGAAIEWGNVPLSPAASAAVASDSTLTEAILTGGDDYEILFTAAPKHRTSLIERAEAIGVAVTEIGGVTGGADVIVKDREGAEMSFGSPSFDHFAASSR